MVPASLLASAFGALTIVGDDGPVIVDATVGRIPFTARPTMADPQSQQAIAVSTVRLFRIYDSVGWSSTRCTWPSVP